MTELQSHIQIILQDAGYETWMASIDGMDAIGFEEELVMGFASSFQSVQQLLDRWRQVEMEFLSAYASSLQRAGEKTWNVYSVFLCTEKGTDTQQREVRWIEEELERTRKIAASGLTTREDIRAALLPILPLQHQPLLDTEDFDVTQRLRRRIESIALPAASAALDPKVSAAEVVRLLGAET
jgi:hypothetical protein